MHVFLLGLSLRTTEGLPGLKRETLELLSIFNLIQVSSIYKRYLRLKPDDLNSELFCIFRGRTDLDLWQLKELLDLRSKKWKIFVFDQLVSVSPDLTVPDPVLHEDPALLRCAAEAWGEFEHPVLGQSLNELMRSVHSFGNVEFYAQGSEIL